MITATKEQGRLTISTRSSGKMVLERGVISSLALLVSSQVITRTEQAESCAQRLPSSERRVSLGTAWALLPRLAGRRMGAGGLCVGLSHLSGNFQ